ncbi:MAG TPA: ribonuclease P protein component [Candidatus Methanoperedens sp.]|nr:ribonuclease P protein component [Candidatus Methanoperedens sp.]
MLKKINRISSKKEFALVKNNGEMKAGELFSIVYLNPSRPTAASPFDKGDSVVKKFGVIVSKKISKKAVERNQIRRRLMEAVRLNMEMFPEGFRGIFLVKKNILDKSEMEIESCLKKINLPLIPPLMKGGENK